MSGFATIKFYVPHYMQGISVEGQENVQELLTKQLVLCQYTCALSILATGMYLFLIA